MTQKSKKSSYGVPYCQTKPDDLGCGMTTGGGFHGGDRLQTRYLALPKLRHSI